MANPYIHALIFLAAVIIPGGLLIYFAWRANKAILKKKHSVLDNIADNIYIPEADEAAMAFRRMFPRHSPDSLRAKERYMRLKRARNVRRNKNK